jgi:general secretion pathway protein A
MLLTLVAPDANTALILFPRLMEMELLQAICEEFEIPAPQVPIRTPKGYVDHLNQFLLQSFERGGRRSVLVIDEAQAMSMEALETIRLLTNLETKTQKLLQIILVGQPELTETLDRNELRQLKQRIGTHSRLRPLDVSECERYIKSRIEQVVNGNFIKFDITAIKAIHELSGGIPRRINHICQQVIMEAQEKRVRLIDGQQVREALGIRSRNLFSFLHRGRS